MVIIGIIAALCIPAISAATRRHETSTRLKKVFAALNDACIKSKASGYDWEVWAENADGSSGNPEEFADKYLLPYLNYMKTEVKGIHLYVYLTDGSYIKVRNGGCIVFVTDVNGEKATNVIGRDNFSFTYCPYSMPMYHTGKVAPYSYLVNANRQRALEECKSNGDTCSELLMRDGWEFKKDYPYSI